jgi:hypothetical protein
MVVDSITAWMLVDSMVVVDSMSAVAVSAASVGCVGGVDGGGLDDSVGGGGLDDSIDGGGVDGCFGSRVVGLLTSRKDAKRRNTQRWCTPLKTMVHYSK